MVLLYTVGLKVYFFFIRKGMKEKNYYVCKYCHTG